jgi:hypothetical protein
VLIKNRARLAKIKQDQAKSMSKRGHALGRKSSSHSNRQLIIDIRFRRSRTCLDSQTLEPHQKLKILAHFAQSNIYPATHLFPFFPIQHVRILEA